MIEAVVVDLDGVLLDSEHIWEEVRALIAVPSALSSVLIARSAINVQLKITRQGQALLEYRKGGSKQYVLLWGALNARAHPSCGKIQGAACGPAQVEMLHTRLLPGGAAGRKLINGPNACHKYDGPKLGWLVAACKAPDGTYWAAQSWVRIARNHSSTDSGVKELRISHWRGPLEKVVVKRELHAGRTSVSASTRPITGARSQALIPPAKPSARSKTKRMKKSYMYFPSSPLR